MKRRGGNQSEFSSIKMTKAVQYARRLKNSFQSRIQTPLRKQIARLPFPVRLPCGAFFLTSDDVLGKHLRERDHFEKGEQKLLQAYLQEGMIVIDVGAHQGLYTLLASMQVGKKGWVFSFEPSPRERRRLKWNLRLNFCRNVKIEPLALGKTEGTSNFYVCLGKETGCNSLRPPTVKDPIEKITVRVHPLDQYLKAGSIHHVDLIKIDAEGSELEVLQGSAETLNSSRPILLCELADSRTAAWGYQASEIYEFLRAKKILWYSITQEGKLRPCGKQSTFRANLLAIPEEKIESLRSFMDVYGS